MSQLDTPSAWRKAHRRRLSLVGLGQLELLLLLVLDTVGVRDETRTVAGDVRPDVGWATRDDGRPLSRRELAALCRLAPGAAGLAELAAAVDGLVELGHVVVADDGAVGVSAWAELQESPDALRKRDKRRTEPGQDADTARTFRGMSAPEDRRQKTEFYRRLHARGGHSASQRADARPASAPGEGVCRDAAVAAAGIGPCRPGR